MPSLRAKWILPVPEPDAIAGLASALKIQPLTAEILWNRGYRNPEAAQRFLRPTLDHLHDPFLLTGMREALTRLQRAIALHEPVLIYGDYDVDGTVSVVMLKKAIELAGGTATFYVPHRIREGYGMRSEVMERAYADGIRLVVSVDTGTRAGEAVRAAMEVGLDVIVTDHHLPEAELPPALAVLNPNRPDCHYPSKDLCGAGVTFKLVQALIASLPWTPERKQRMIGSFLKLAAIATVADVVPLTGENRVIVKHGLDGLTEVKNPGLRALLEVSRLLDGSAPTAHEVAFQIAPRINAAGRMAHAEDVVHLFLTDDETRARSLAQQLHGFNQERQETEAEMVRAILDACTANPVTDDQAALVFSAPGWHRGVAGIVASRLTDRFCRPAFVLSEEEDGNAYGSGRSIPAFHLLDALESMPGLFGRFGGHRQAAGLSLPCERVDEFRRRLNAYARERLTPDDFCPQITIDAVANLRDLSESTAFEILSLGPFGFGNPAPLLTSRDVEICGPATFFKEKHARVPMRQNGRTLMSTAWNFAARCDEYPQGSRLDIVFAVEEDAWSASRGWPGWRTVLRDIRPLTSVAEQSR